MHDPGDQVNPCPEAVARATIAIWKRGRYRLAVGAASDSPSDVSLDVGRLGRPSVPAASTILSPHTTLPTVAGIEEYSSESDPRLSIFEGGAFEAAQWLLQQQSNEGSLPLVLDFASDSEPGGGWKGKQRGTQEECLCRQSSLGIHLEEHYSAVGSAAYMPHMALVYIPHVVVFRASEREHYHLLEAPFDVAVVAGAMRSTGPLEIRQKIDGVIRLACAHGHRTLVLGAWGCGAFGNDPSEVCQSMIAASHLARGCVDRIVFSLPRMDDNYRAFVAVLQEPEIITPDWARSDSASLSTDSKMAQRLLLAALHPDTMTTAVDRAAIGDGALQTLEGIKSAAQQWLQEVIVVCLDDLKGAFSESLIIRFQDVLAVCHDDGAQDGVSSLSAEEMFFRSSFLEAARALVQASPVAQSALLELRKVQRREAAGSSVVK